MMPRQTRLLMMLAGVLLAVAGPPVHAQTSMLAIDGQPGEMSGASIAALGDLNGDGFGDLAIGVPTGGGGTGFVRVISGFDGGIVFILSPPPGASNAFGAVVAGAGDLNNDGTPDILVTASGPGPPMVMAFSGATGLLLATVTGPTGTTFGQSIAGLGDFNGDGFGDFAVGASTVATVYAGPTGALIVAIPFFSLVPATGITVAAMGDLNNDGKADIVCSFPGNGAPPTTTNIGLVQVFYGPAGTPGWVVVGPNQSRLGERLTVIGDQNGDGVNDVLVGAPGGLATSTGFVRVLSGFNGATLRTVTSTAQGDGFGKSLVGLNDIDGDAIGDFVVGAPQSNVGFTNGGWFIEYSGATGAVLGSATGSAPGANFAMGLSGPTISNGDGFADFFVGEPGSAAALGGGGRVHAYSGVTLQAAHITGLNPSCGPPGQIPALGLSLPPVLGQTTVLGLTSATPNTAGFLVASPGGPSPNQIGGGCWVFVNLGASGTWTVIPFTSDSTGAWSLPVPLPQIPFFLGYTLTLQAVLPAPGIGPNVALSNGQWVFFGV